MLRGWLRRAALLHECLPGTRLPVLRYRAVEPGNKHIHEGPAPDSLRGGVGVRDSDQHLAARFDPREAVSLGCLERSRYIGGIFGDGFNALCDRRGTLLGRKRAHARTRKQCFPVEFHRRAGNHGHFLRTVSRVCAEQRRGTSSIVISHPPALTFPRLSLSRPCRSHFCQDSRRGHP